MFGTSKKEKPTLADKSAPKTKKVKVEVEEEVAVVCCPDCRPRRDDITDRSSGLTDHDTVCPTCNGSGQIEVEDAPEDAEAPAEEE